MRPERFLSAVVGALAALVITSHLLGATVLKGTMWGAHFYGFFPPAVLLAALAGAAGLALWLWARVGAQAVPVRRPPGIVRLLVPAALAAVSFLFFWLLRIRHTLLGDSGVLSHNLPLGEHSHPRQPLSLLFHHATYQWTRGLFQAPGRDPRDVAYDSVALGSAVAGSLFVLVVLAVARRLATRGPEPGGPQASPSVPVMSPALVAAVLLAQGCIQLFFGYVENYTWFTLALALYVWAALSFLAGRSPLVLASLALVVAIGLNLSGIVLLPSLAILGAWGLFRPASRAGVVRDAVATVVMVVALERLLAALGGGYSAAGGVRYMWDLVARGEGGENSPAYLLSLAHARDFINEHVLIGPFAAFLLVPVALHRVLARSRRDPTLLFLLACALPALLASWIFGDPLQGFPRDWDIFAPFAWLYAATALYCVASEPAPAVTKNRLLAVALAVSLFHTGSWVAINTSFSRSFERYKTLPTSRGRTESVVGQWYLTHGRLGEARAWFERAIAAHPGNNAARYHLGLIAMDEHRYEEAIPHFRIATEVRPDKTNYRLGLVDALVLAGHPDQALPELERILQVEPNRAHLWGCEGIVLAGLGRIAEARAALERAAALAPHEPRFAQLLAELDRPGFYARALRAHWDDLVVQ